jgi:hypothetical protein
MLPYTRPAHSGQTGLQRFYHHVYFGDYGLPVQLLA